MARGETRKRTGLELTHTRIQGAIRFPYLPFPLVVGKCLRTLLILVIHRGSDISNEEELHLYSRGTRNILKHFGIPFLENS